MMAHRSQYSSSNKHTTTSGSALLLILGAIVFATILILAAFSRVQTASGIVRSGTNASIAARMEQEALNEVLAMLADGTADSDTKWASRPGELIIFNEDDIETIPLHTGLAADATQGVNLNAAALTQPDRNFLTGSAGPAMLAKWISVYENGTRTDTPGVFDPSNKIIGRYAYWVDDESTKLNLNTSYTRLAASNPTFPSHPSQIPLQVLSSTSAADGESLADAIHTTRTTQGVFHSVGDALRSVEGAPNEAEWREDLRRAIFSTTHLNSSPESTFFNEPKIVLTTDATRANGRPYINLNDIPGTVALLNSYLTRTDWPILAGASYQDKFFSGSPDRITQISLNIIDTVRAKETPTSATPLDTGILFPIRGAVNAGGNFEVNLSTGLSNSFKSMSRGPRITELALWRASQPNADGTRNWHFLMEIHLPENGGLDSIDLTKLGRYKENFGEGNNARISIAAAECYPNATLLAGEYRVVSWEVSQEATKDAGSTRNMRVPLFLNNTAIDVVPLEALPLVDPSTSIPVPVTDGETGKTSISISDATSVVTSTEVDDPYVNSRRQDWVPRSSGSSFGAANSIRSVGQSAQKASPEQDMDASGNITDIGVRLPHPAGHPSNPTGRVESVGELGFIHTGLQTAGAGIDSTPWRTLRLQPRHPDALASNTLPDWALLDIFTVPSADAADPLVNPSRGTTAGRVNINSKILPFTGVDRILALTALMTDLESVPSGFDPIAAAGDVAAKNPANTSVAEGKFTNPDAVEPFAHPAEIIEVAGVADGGEASESVVRQIIDHVSIRTNVFLMQVAAQAVVQTPNGDIQVLAENRAAIAIERIEDDATSPAAIRFRQSGRVQLSH